MAGAHQRVEVLHEPLGLRDRCALLRELLLSVFPASVQVS
jgi:hypothetical protein